MITDYSPPATPEAVADLILVSWPWNVPSRPKPNEDPDENHPQTNPPGHRASWRVGFYQRTRAELLFRRTSASILRGWPAGIIWTAIFTAQTVPSLLP